MADSGANCARARSTARQRPPVVIVHDYLTQQGGAERVVLSMLEAFPDAPVYTAVYEPEATFPEFAQHDVRPLWTNRLRVLRRDHRLGLFLYPLAFSSLRLDADAVLCSSSGFSHGVRTAGRKVVYCYNPPRWLYDQADNYLASWPKPITTMVRLFGPMLRQWDQRAAATADSYLTSSSLVKDRIRAAYGVDASLVPPPVPSITGPTPSRQIDNREPGFMLCVSRLLAYKNVDAVVAAFNELPGVSLAVVGRGPELGRLQALAGPNVEFLGRVDDAELQWLYANCAGAISASYEDFGLTTIEAAAHGKPSAALAYGGFLDTLVAGETGVFFDRPNPAEIAERVRELLGREWDARAIMRHAEAYSQSAFSATLVKAVSGTDQARAGEGDRMTNGDHADANQRECDFWGHMLPSVDQVVRAVSGGPDPNTAAMLDAVEPLSGKRVLDFACGAGMTTVWLAQRGAKVTGLDITPAAIELARQAAAILDVEAEFVACPVEDFEPDVQFDAIVGRYALHHVDIPATGRALGRLLDVGGRAAFVETMATNPLLMFARGRLIGHFGIPRLGTEDEHPLTTKDIECLEGCFGPAEDRTARPVFLRLFDRQVLRCRWPWASKAAGALDDVLLRGDRARRWSYQQVICFSR